MNHIDVVELYHFDASGQISVIAADHEAKKLGHPEVGAHHLLLAVAALPETRQILSRRKLSYPRVLERLLRVQPAQPQRFGDAVLPWSPSGMRAIELADQFRYVSGEDEIRAPHIGVAICQEVDELRAAGATAAYVLDHASVKPFWLGIELASAAH